MYSINDFDYELPREFIAQLPAEKRQNSKLMVVHKKRRLLENRSFFEIGGFFSPGDLLVFNDTKVLPARIIGKKLTGGKVEVFLLEDKSKDSEILWEVLVKPGIKAGTTVVFSEQLSCEVLNILEEGKRLVRFKTASCFFDLIEKLGQIPLPPYINYKEEQKEVYKQRYQTVYAEKEGAVAAPTAGLHFSNDLLSELKTNGIDFAFLTLHVGIGTFRPIKCENYIEHKMHAERYELPKETIDKIINAKRNGNKVIAVGTTTTRVLEGVFAKNGFLKAGQGTTDIFIYPGFSFGVVDAMITNFHLPKSSLLLMVSALADKDLILNAYEKAKDLDYRFFSFGDAMLII